VHLFLLRIITMHARREGPQRLALLNVSFRTQLAIWLKFKT
jgi:hypothetical protein